MSKFQALHKRALLLKPPLHEIEFAKYFFLLKIGLLCKLNNDANDFLLTNLLINSPCTKLKLSFDKFAQKLTKSAWKWLSYCIFICKRWKIMRCKSFLNYYQCFSPGFAFELKKRLILKGFLDFFLVLGGQALSFL